MSREWRLAIRWIIIGTATLAVLGFLALVISVGVQLGYPVVSFGLQTSGD